MATTHKTMGDIRAEAKRAALKSMAEAVVDEALCSSLFAGELEAAIERVVRRRFSVTSGGFSVAVGVAESAA